MRTSTIIALWMLAETVPVVVASRLSEGTLVQMLTAILAAIPPTLVALAALRQGRVNAQKTDEVKVQTAEVIKKTDDGKDRTDEVVKKVDEIHTITNSNFQKVSTENQLLTQEVAGLKALMASIAAANASAELERARMQAPPVAHLAPPAYVPEAATEIVDTRLVEVSKEVAKEIKNATSGIEKGK